LARAVFMGLVLFTQSDILSGMKKGIEGSYR
jgi:hypothetical protein